MGEFRGTGNKDDAKCGKDCSTDSYMDNSSNTNDDDYAECSLAISSKVNELQKQQNEILRAIRDTDGKVSILEKTLQIWLTKYDKVNDKDVENSNRSGNSYREPPNYSTPKGHSYADNDIASPKSFTP
uniref:Uncharacterized protein n=1 Tax=Oryza nivara TaxID=4536 RepID=A0A0E0JAU4_ORYNI